ncbi:hypothetical protein O6H91_13G072800 [Diphasiastrum complanatum]|uniref:Uncharacterized protein n=1 Tax=Diphasiastrum complanatum TaxID=34168 RepID=A0ACC2BW41_DIPCM|nr:hypothetical protein O6H91_13G072800 [Diphasiastrum complanatum]
MVDPEICSEISDFSESEDEGSDEYRRGGYHPVRIGEAFKGGRYIVQRKLGWGHFSTVWLAWDRLEDRYVALKVQKSAPHYTEAANDEIAILKKITEGDASDDKCVVKLLDHFKHSGPHGKHVCMVFELLGDNLLSLIKLYDYRGLPLHTVKKICMQILIGLDYLHRELSLIHTDLKPENVLLLAPLDPAKTIRCPPFLGDSIDKSTGHGTSIAAGECKRVSAEISKNQKKKLKRKAKKAGSCNANQEEVVKSSTNSDKIPEVEGNYEESYPEMATVCTAFKEDHTENNDAALQHHVAGSSQSEASKHGAGVIDLERLDLRCKIVDLGNACWTYKQITSDIQTRQYRCPEVLLGAKYSTPADMWSFACIVFELATGDFLFDPNSGDKYDRDEVYAQPTRRCIHHIQE